MVAGIVRRDLVFAPRWDLASVLGAVFMCYTLVAYPLIGMFGGHPLRTLPVFGLAPCPTVIFFFGLLLWARPPMPKYVLLLPLAWALNAAPSNLAMGHVADFVLILAGVITAGLIIWRDRTSSWQTAAGPEGQRLLFIDNLRIVLICGVLVVHLAVTYRAIGDWYYYDPAYDLLTAILLSFPNFIGMATTMGVFFLLAGYFTSGSYDRRGAGPFLRDRLVRLGIPLLIYDSLIRTPCHLGRRPSVYWILFWRTPLAGVGLRALVGKPNQG